MERRRRAQRPVRGRNIVCNPLVYFAGVGATMGNMISEALCQLRLQSVPIATVKTSSRPGVDVLRLAFQLGYFDNSLIEIKELLGFVL